MRHLPNFITLLNLLCGCLAVISILNGDTNLTGILIINALIFDFLDGFLARMLNAYSEIGKQLDSLADMVSFGFVPGMIMYKLFIDNYPVLQQGDWMFKIGSIFMFIVTLFSALRLSLFNIDPRQASYFIGVPTPAITLLILAFPFIALHDQFGIAPFLLQPLSLMIIAAICSYLLVAEIPLISLKIKSLKWSESKAQLLLIIGAIVLGFTLRFAASPVIIIYYILLSLIYPPNKKQVV